MLHGINSNVTPDLLSVLARMGHGDEIVIADSNYPSMSTAATCDWPDVIHYPGFSSTQLAELITGLMPLDGFHDYAALRMEVDDAPQDLNDVHREVFDILGPRCPEGAVLSSINRHKFYTQAATAFAVVQCSESRAFGCFILRKGVIF